MYHTSPYHKHNPGTAAYHRKAGKRIAALLFVWVMLVTMIPTGGFTEKSGPVCGLEEHPEHTGGRTAHNGRRGHPALHARQPPSRLPGFPAAGAEAEAQGSRQIKKLASRFKDPLPLKHRSLRGSIFIRFSDKEAIP